MAIPITIPRLGWSMEEGTFGEWVLQDGDRVESGAPIFLMESEKALQEVESIDDGILHVLPNGPQPGDTVAVGMLIGYLLEDGEDPPVVTAEQSAASTEAVEKSTPQTEGPREETSQARLTPRQFHSAISAPAAPPSVRRLARELNVDLTMLHGNDRLSEREVRRESTELRTTSASASQLSRIALGRIPRRNADPALPKISPRAERLARERGIDWTQLRGSGRTGRIRACDIPDADPHLKAEVVSRTPPPGQVIPMTATRRAIAERMALSAVTTVPVTLTRTINVSELVERRRQLREQDESAVPAIHDYFIEAVTVAIGEQPEIQRQWSDEGLFDPAETAIGLAIDTEQGLVVPVVRSVRSMSLAEITTTTTDLIGRARNRRIRLEELSGGTFSITNLGGMDIDAFTPVINPPECAILGLGAIRKVPVFGRNDELASEHRMTLSLTFDHRITDGANAARFLRRLAELIQKEHGDTCTA